MLRLTCRIDGCESSEYFDYPEQITEWEEVSVFGVSEGRKTGETVYEHRGFCPNHALD